jgi:hypothetical protein
MQAIEKHIDDDDESTDADKVIRAGRADGLI